MVQKDPHEIKSERQWWDRGPEASDHCPLAKLLDTLLHPCSENYFRLVQDFKD